MAAQPGNIALPTTPPAGQPPTAGAVSYARFGGPNPLMVHADTEAKLAGQEGIIDSALKFAGYGVTNAFISGGVGIYNSLKGLANTFGADLPMTDTAQIVGDVVGQAGKNYYIDNKPQEDVGGLVLSTVATFGGGALAMKALQARGVVSAGAAAATGLGNADVALGTGAANAMREAVLANPLQFTWRTPQFAKAWGIASAQSISQALVGEGVFLLANNQNPILNPDGLSSWESSKRAFEEGFWWVAGFAAFGSAVSGLRLYGNSKQVFDDLQNANRALVNPAKEAIATFNTPGDVAADALRLQTKLQQTIASGSVDMTQQPVRTLADAGTREVEHMYQQAAVRANSAGASGTDFFEQMKTLPQTDQFAHLGNLVSVRIASAKDLQDAENFLWKTPGIQGAAIPAANDFPAIVKFLQDANRAKLAGNENMWVQLSKELSRGAAKGPDAPATFLDQVIKYAKDTSDPELAKTFLAASKRIREINASQAMLPGVRRAAAALGKQFGIKLGGAVIPPELAQDLLEGISKIAGRMNAMQTGHEATAAMPYVTRMLAKVGAHAEPYSATKAWYNVRTRMATTSALPRANDLGAVKDDVYGMRIEGTEFRAPYAPDTLHPRNVLAKLNAGALDEAVSSSTIVENMHYAAAAQRDLKYWETAASSEANPVYRVLPNDLPAMERLATGAKGTARIEVLGEPGKMLSPAELAQRVLDTKAEWRAMYQQAGLNEKLIANLLNTGEDFAMGAPDAKDGLLMGLMDYSKPEQIRTVYRSYDTADTALASRSYAGFAARIEAQAALEAEASSKVRARLDLHDIPLPDERPDLLTTLSQTETTAGFVHGAQNAWQQFRQYATTVGTRVHGMIDKNVDRINKLFLPHYEKLAVKDAVFQRSQFALFNNLARTDSYRVFKLPALYGNASHLAIKEELFNQHLFDATQNGYMEDQALEMLLRPDKIRQLTQTPDNGALALHSDVGALVGMHMAENEKYCANDVDAAAAIHSSPTRRPEIYYPPPVNLKRTPYHLFVSPAEGLAEEAPSYMLFANTAAELEAKRAYAMEKLGNRYRVVDSTEQTLYKKYRSEYEEGRVFDQWDFDENLRKLGKTGDAAPNMDVNAAETLDLMRNWHHHKTARQIRQAVELKYATTMNALRQGSSTVDFAERGGNMGQRIGKLDIYEDTRRVMLDRPTYDSSLTGSTYFKVQDFAAGKISAALDATGWAIGQMRDAALRAGGRGAKQFGAEEFDQLTRDLNDAGFVNPFNSVGEMLMHSSNISDGRSLGQLTRLLNTVVASTMLRLDPLNSLLQIVSAPILGLPVLREAKRVLAGTAAGERLLDMTTVQHPISGLREPTAAKLLATGIRNYFTDTGKEFAAEMQKRFLLPDFEREWRDASDFSSLNGRHTIMDVQNKVDKWTEVLSKYSGHAHAEALSRFMVADAVRQICELRGIGGEEMWSVVENAVNQVHGIHRKNMRVQMFNGPIGQSIGLFQSYMFNYAHYMLRAVADGRGKDAAIAAMVQTGLFGVRSLPGFQLLNHQVAKANSGMVDLYTMAGTDDDPKGFGSYLLYGTVPMDLYTRGDIAVRQATVVPLDPTQWASYTTFLKAGANLVRTAAGVFNAVTSGGTAEEKASGAMQALSYGLAHNGLSRPLQGWGTIWNGNVTTQQGTPLFVNSNWKEYDPAKGLNYMALGARLLGGKPRDEALLLDAYYRRTAYQSEIRKRTMDIGAEMRTALLSGHDIPDGQMMDFMQRFEAAGGQVENFNQFFSQQLTAANASSVYQFRTKLQQDGPVSRAYNRLRDVRNTTPAWEEDAALVRQQE